MTLQKHKGKFGIAAKVALVNGLCISVCLAVAVFIVITLERDLTSEMIDDQVEQINAELLLQEQEMTAVVEKNIQKNAAILNAVSAVPLYDFDQEGVMQAIVPYLDNEAILAITVSDTSQPFSSAWRENGKIVTDTSLPSSLTFQESQKLALETVLDGEKVGKLTVIYTDKAVKEKIEDKRTQAQSRINAVREQTNNRIMDAILSQALIMCIVVIVLIGTVSITLKKIVITPLSKVSNVIRLLAQGDVNIQVDTNGQDEIGQVLLDLDSMKDVLKRRAILSDTIATGDLTVEVKVESDKDVLGNALHSMTQNLNKTIGDVNTATELITSRSGQVSSSSQSLSQGATEQAASIEEISSSMTQMASQTRTSAENAEQANQLAAEARNAAKNGDRQMQEMVGAMEQINEAGQNISKIIKTIDEIAFQTNLLALNAAVEAARAGQHGKGFAVVAEEVRNLAARSAKAASETAELIEGSVAKTRRGSTIVNGTAESLQEIVESITKVTDLVGEIAMASNEQAEGIDQVNQGLTQVDQVTQSNTAIAEEAASAAEELSGMAVQLQQLVTQFKLKNIAKNESFSIEAETTVDQRTISFDEHAWGA
jgi:methyl-accepting chemotaxis protein